MRSSTYLYTQLTVMSVLGAILAINIARHRLKKQTSLYGGNVTVYKTNEHMYDILLSLDIDIRGSEKLILEGLNTSSSGSKIFARRELGRYLGDPTLSTPLEVFTKEYEVYYSDLYIGYYFTYDIYKILAAIPINKATLKLIYDTNELVEISIIAAKGLRLYLPLFPLTITIDVRKNKHKEFIDTICSLKYGEVLEKRVSL